MFQFNKMFQCNKKSKELPVLSKYLKIKKLSLLD